TVIVDDDENSMELLSDYCHGLPYVDVAGRFLSPTKFIELLPALDFDLCVLDLNLPVINGLKIAEQVKGTPIIFVTAGERMLKAATELAPLDIISKPFTKERLDIAFLRAYHLYGERPAIRKKSNSEKQKYELFSIDGIQGKFKLKLSDILFVYTDTHDPRHKNVIMKNGSTYRVMDCKFEKLLALAPNLVRLNGSQMISLDLVQNYTHDKVLLSSPVGNKQLKEITLNRTFRKNFKERMTAWL
ncbi:MAG TPA: response regulator, partial [Nitrosopumilaceae archaeon]|nr:response regulator [Nitrosopumilaceae archaeon]